MFYRIVLSCLLLFSLLTACERMITSQPTCNEIKAFQDKIGTEFTSMKFIDWVVERYVSLKAEEINVRDDPLSGILHTWKMGNYQYAATLEEGVLTKLVIGKRGRGGMPARDVIACLGEPDSYRAIYERGHIELSESTRLNFQLFFSDLGIYAEGDVYYNHVLHSPLSIEEDFPISFFFLVRNDTSMGILDQLYSDNVELNYPEIRPWPGAWEDIQVYITPEIEKMLQGLR